MVTRILYVVELDKSGDGDTENVLLPRIFVFEAILLLMRGAKRKPAKT